MLLNLKNKKIQNFCATYSLLHIDKGLLRQAFTHSSAANKNNERLEFLGDAILGCIIAEKLYVQLPEAKEHYLTRLRAHLVNKNALAALAEKLEFSEMLILGEGERKTGGRQRHSILADAFEAVIGAIFVSAGYTETRDFVLRVYAELLNALPSESILKDPKTRLQEWLQQRGFAIPQYTIVAESGKPHDKLFTVEVRVEVKPKGKMQSEHYFTQAQGNSRRAAEQQAAQDQLEQLTSLTS